MSNSWNLPVKAIERLDVWKEKTKRLKKTLKGWHLNIEGSYRKTKKMSTQKNDALDSKGEVSVLSDQERQEKLCFESDLRRLLAEEEIKMRQKAREKIIVDGDENTKYFHLRTKGRRRLKIQSLCQEGLIIEGEDGINKVATDFYRELFGPSYISHINMRNFNMTRLDDNDKSFLTGPLFSVEEVKNVVDNLKHNSAPGPDGLHTVFF